MKTKNAKGVNIISKTETKVSIPDYDDKSILVIKLGNEDQPACAKDIQDMLTLIRDGIINGKSNIMATHHAIEFMVLPRKLFTKDVKCITSD